MRWARIAVLLPSLLAGACEVSAQEPGPAWEQATCLLEAALAAHGSPDSLLAAGTLVLRGSGVRRWWGQGPRPSVPSELPLYTELRLDASNQRLTWRQTTYQDWAPYFAFRMALSADSSFYHEWVTDVFTPIPPSAFERNYDSRTDYFLDPPKRLRTALEAEGLRLEADETIDGRLLRVVSHAAEGEGRWKLYLDAGSLLLARAEHSPVPGALGEVVQYVDYRDYRSVRGHQIPHAIERLARFDEAGGRLIDSVSFEPAYLVDPIDEVAFHRPEKTFPRRPAAEPTVTRVADGVYFLENSRPNYNQLVVEFDEFLVVVDAPQGPGAADVLDLIRREVSTKPIRYVVLTHFHYDHSGNVHHYVREGAAVVTSSGNVAFIEALAEGMFDLEEKGVIRPPEDAGPGRPTVKVEVVEGRRVIGDGRRSIVLHDIGPNRHADELLIVEVPHARTLFVADVFSADWGRVRPAIPETFDFARSLEELDLHLEVLLPAHGPRATMADLEWSLKEGGRMEAELRRSDANGAGD